MKNKINVAELLKDCPKGMELNCAIYDNVTFGCILDGKCYPILIQTPEGAMQLSEYGCLSLNTHAKCVIFPKSKNTWEGFKPPCKFKDGDIISNGICICIYNGNENDEHYGCYVGVGHINFPDYFINRSQHSYFTKENSRLATEEEKQKLFQAIKENGYKWNAETKTLEKLVEPKFKVGDRIKWKGHDAIGRIVKIEGNVYNVDYGYDDGILLVNFKRQDDYELISDEKSQPYKEEIMEENLTIQDIRDNNAEWLLNKLQAMSAEGALQTISDLYDELHTPQYPKTIEWQHPILGCEIRLLANLQKFLTNYRNNKQIY